MSAASSPTVAIALAAGYGTRMRPLTDTTPKPLLKVGRRALLDRTIDRLEEVGVRRLVVNVHHHAEQMERHLNAHPRVRISDERAELLETGGGVRRALPLLDAEAFYVANSDNVWIGPRAFAPLAEAWRPDQMDALLLLVPIERAYGYTRPGDFVLGDDGRLVRRGDAPRAPFVYSGAQILSARLFETAPDGAFSLNVVWDRALVAGRAFGVVHHGGWVDVGTPDGLALADRAVSAWPRWSAEPT